MSADRACRVLTVAVLILVVGAVAVGIVGLTGCRTVSEFFDGKATVNKTTILLAVFIAAGIGALVAGWVGILAGGGAGTATTWLSATAPDGSALPPPHIPTFLESLLGFLGTTAGLVIVGLVAWALWNKREWIVKALRGPKGTRFQAAVHALWGGERTRPKPKLTGDGSADLYLENETRAVVDRIYARKDKDTP